MISYPVHIYVKPYSGNDHKRINQFRLDCDAARRIREYLNEKMTNQDSMVFTYSEIAAELGMSEETVRKILFPVDGGHRGITVVNSQRARCSEPTE